MGKITSINRLTAVEMKALTRPGKHHDGGGLYFQVQTAEHRSWLFRHMRNGKQREMGLGAFPEVSLAPARREAERRPFVPGPITWSSAAPRRTHKPIRDSRCGQRIVLGLVAEVHEGRPYGIAGPLVSPPESA